MSLVVQLVVGEFEFVEADHLSRPGVSGGQGVGVDVRPRRDRGVGVACHHPLRAVVHIPAGGEEGGILSTKPTINTGRYCF